LDPTLWNSLDATPWGDRMDRPKVAHPALARNRRTQVHVQDFMFPVGKESVDAERVNRGKRVFNVTR